jgi:hypothetical protein
VTMIKQIVALHWSRPSHTGASAVCGFGKSGRRLRVRERRIFGLGSDLEARRGQASGWLRPSQRRPGNGSDGHEQARSGLSARRVAERAG